MAIGNARQSHEQQTHYIRKTVNYNDANIAGGVLAGTLPAGALIVDAIINVGTAFNAGTTNSLVAGTTATGSDILQASDTVAGTAGGKRATTPLGKTFAADTDIFVSYAQSGTAATAGQATIVIEYAPNNDK